MAVHNITALKFKDGETTATGPAFLVHYKVVNTGIEGSTSITTRHGLRYNSDDFADLRQVIANTCNDEPTLVDRFGEISADSVQVISWSPYTS
jgi:hypothetical protein